MIEKEPELQENNWAELFLETNNASDAFKAAWLAKANKQVRLTPGLRSHNLENKGGGERANVQSCIL